MTSSNTQTSPPGKPQMAPEIIIYTKVYCPYCQAAKALLVRRGLAFDEIAVDHDAALQNEMIERSGRRTVPQIFINGQHVGGHDDLVAAERSGALDRLLAG